MYDYLLLVGRLVHSLAADGHLARFDGSECEVLFAALRFFNFENQDIRAQNKTLAETAGVSDATAGRSLSALVTKGYLTGEPGHWKLGPVLVAISEAHARVVKQHAVSSSKARENNGSVELSEAQRQALGRKGVTATGLGRLVAEHGSEVVDQALSVMNAQYPDDARVRTSFLVLVARACEHQWVNAKREQALRREQQVEASALAAPPETATVVILPDGTRLPVVGRLASGAVQVVVERRGRTEVSVIPPSRFQGLRWAQEVVASHGG